MAHGEQLHALAATRTGALVGDVLMKAYGWKVGDRIPLTTSVVKQDGSTDWSLDIVGTYSVTGAEAQANRVLINYVLRRSAAVRQGPGVRIHRGIDDPDRSAAMCATIDALFSNSSDETLTRTRRL